MDCGDPNESAETCGLEWFEAFSAQCAGVGSLAGLIAGAALGAITSAVLAAAFAGSLAVIGAIIGFCACRLSPNRLPRITPGDVSIVGIVNDVGRSLPLFPFGDGDFLFNIRCVDRRLLATNSDGAAACIRTKAGGPEYLHCEITSNVTAFGCAGAIAGASAGAAVGVVAGTAAGAAVAAACLATGIFAPLCILAAIIIALIIGAAATGAGGLAGGAVGSAAGVAADEIENQVGDADADVVTCGDIVVFSGDFVTDADHNWNEIHELKSAMVIDQEITNCDEALELAAAIGAGLMIHPKHGHGG